MGVGKAVLWLVHSLLRLRPVAWKGISRVVMFHRGGVMTYVGISLVIVGDNFEAFRTFLLTLNPVPLFESIGMNLAGSWNRFLDGVLAAIGASTPAPVSFFGITLPLPPAFVGGWLMLVSLVTIGWYFRTIHLGLSAQWGDWVPWSLSFIVGLLFFPVLVWGATGGLPVERTVRVFSTAVNGEAGAGG